MKLVFIFSAVLILYTYFAYPVMLLLLAGLKQLSNDLRFGLGRRNRRIRAADGSPRVSLVFSAHNEAAVIEEKLRNCRELLYPADRLEILIGCDACSDDTVPLVQRAALANVQLFNFVHRSGKPSVLNRLVPLATGEFVILCDANTMFEPATIRSLVRHFTQPDIGCVCGELRLRRGSKPSGEGVYWKYETLLKFLESRLNMLVGANGGVFAIRKSLFEPIPPDGIIDDFLVAMQVRQRGHRVVYDSEAVAWEDASPSVRHEFRRRIRIGAGNFHALRYTWRLLNPAAGMIALAYWSHKVCRWLAPLALCAAMVSALALAWQPFYAACALSGFAMMCLAAIGYVRDGRGEYRAVYSIPYYFVAMNLALLLGLFRFLQGTQTVVWSPTARQPAQSTSEVTAEKALKDKGAAA